MNAALLPRTPCPVEDNETETDQCFVCLGEDDEIDNRLVRMGCGCKLVAHVECMCKWYLPRIRVVQTGLISERNWTTRYHVPCSMCGKDIDRLFCEIATRTLTADRIARDIAIGSFEKSFDELKKNVNLYVNGADLLPIPMGTPSVDQLVQDTTRITLLRYAPVGVARFFYYMSRIVTFNLLFMKAPCASCIVDAILERYRITSTSGDIAWDFILFLFSFVTGVSCTLTALFFICHYEVI